MCLRIDLILIRDADPPPPHPHPPYRTDRYVFRDVYGLSYLSFTRGCSLVGSFTTTALALRQYPLRLNLENLWVKLIRGSAGFLHCKGGDWPGLPKQRFLAEISHPILIKGSRGNSTGSTVYGLPRDGGGRGGSS